MIAEGSRGQLNCTVSRWAFRFNLTVSVVIAKKEYEAWFLAAAKSLAGQRGLSDQLDPPLDPESIGGAGVADGQNAERPELLANQASVGVLRADGSFGREESAILPEIGEGAEPLVGADRAEGLTVPAIKIRRPCWAQTFPRFCGHFLFLRLQC